MAKGIVKWFDKKKGYGFITPDGGGKDIFVHITEVDKAGISAMNEGDAISYEVGEDKRTSKKVAMNLAK